jgi:SAM-dependent methyltransferase
MESLCRRNALRSYQVPEDYIARCVGGAVAFATWLDRQSDIRWLQCDTSVLSVSQLHGIITGILRQSGSSTLSRLALAPVADQPYVGGHLIDAIEWDEHLVVLLQAMFGVTSALDVGCGLGLSVELFGQLGIAAWGIDGNRHMLDGRAVYRERLLVVDFTKQWVEWPSKVDLVWCVEVLEHVPEQFEDHVLQTIARNAKRLAFVSAAPPGQPGYCHVNCKPREYWIHRLEALGLRYSSHSEFLLSQLSDVGPLGPNFLKRNGMLFEAPA